jgi:hypothetical protein
MRPMLQAVTDPGVARLPSQYPAIPSLLDEMCDEGISPEKASTYLFSSMLTTFITDDVEPQRRGRVLEQLEQYAQAATKGQGASALPTDDLALLILFLEDQTHRWAEAGAVTKVESDIFLSELIGALRGVAPRDRTMGRMMEFLASVNRPGPAA